MTAQEFVMFCVYSLAGILGLCVGSFLNVVIYRLPNEMNLSKPGSHCTKCNYSLKWYDNIPVLSYCFLGGKWARYFSLFFAQQSTRKNWTLRDLNAKNAKIYDEVTKK